MGRTRDGLATDKHLENTTDTPPVPSLTWPATMMASFLMPSDPVNPSGMCIVREASNEYSALQTFTPTGLDVGVHHLARSGGPGGSGPVTAPQSAIDVWHVGVGTTVAGNSRTVWINGGNEVTGTSNRTPDPPTDTYILMNTAGNGGILSQQRTIVWDSVLTDEEIIMMSQQRVSPFAIRSRIPKAYWPLLGGVSGAKDLVGPVDLVMAAGGVGEIGGPVYRGPRVID